MLGIHDFWLFIISGLLLNVTPGPDMAYICRPQRATGMARRHHGCARHFDRLPEPCLRVRDRPVGAADGVGDGVHRGEMARRGLSLLCRPDHAVVAGARARQRRAGREQQRVAVARVLAGRADQRAESESGAVLPRLPAAIRRCGGGAQGARLPGARSDLHFQRHAMVCGRCDRRGPRVGPSRKSGRTMDFVNRGLGALFVYLGARIALAHAK